MANSHSFPLLRLPNKIPTQVLRCMNGLQILLISLISRKTKNLVKSLEIGPHEFNITIDRKITLTLVYPPITLDFYEIPEESMRTLEKPSKISMTLKNGRAGIIKFSNVENSLGLKDWFDHLCYIFHHRKACHMSVEAGSEAFEVNAIRYCFPKIRRLEIPGLSPEHSRNVLEVFYQNVDELHIISNPFSEEDPLHKRLLIQNFNELILAAWGNFQLDDLTICNAAVIIFQVRQNFVGINQFLKLWIRGSNPRLKRLRISHFSQRNQSHEEILKGINISRRIPDEEDVFHTQRHFRRTKGSPEFKAVEIQRYDGTKGTVVIFRNYTWLLVDVDAPVAIIAL